MTRYLRFTLVALIVFAMGVPAFALHCNFCNDQCLCENDPDSGQRCRWVIDCCETISAPTCSGVADQDTLSGTLTVASVEVDTPAGVATEASQPQRLAAQRPAPKVTAASPYIR